MANDHIWSTKPALLHQFCIHCSKMKCHRIGIPVAPSQLTYWISRYDGGIQSGDGDGQASSIKLFPAQTHLLQSLPCSVTLKVICFSSHSVTESRPLFPELPDFRELRPLQLVIHSGGQNLRENPQISLAPPPVVQLVQALVDCHLSQASKQALRGLDERLCYLFEIDKHGWIPLSPIASPSCK
ncbi:hypothetical protein SAY87_006395 [Trapa incisa]|uniref:Uncharacterized protein n=1 Tax=Trapa incisa TaxID=236973 RepID=A0AAN7JWI0_9MYRT|nr:hypothetical protein SAY87_006395 [Trapa incisa]